MTLSVAERLAQWAHDYVPSPQDLNLAQRSLRDTLAVTLAARNSPLRQFTGQLPEVSRWAALGHVLSFDDLHIPSTAHVGVVCVPAVLASGGNERAYLGAAGVMARLGTALGWRHYANGWHTTCTAGAPAAAVGASLAFGLDVARIAAAMALAVPAAGGVQRAFGTSAKALQVGFAVEAGVRAARLAAAGVDADPQALDQWLSLVGGDPAALDLSTPAVPGGLAMKMFPCCYSLQRPISAVRQLLARPLDAEIDRITVIMPGSAARPLIRHLPRSGPEATFSLEYAVAATFLDGAPTFASFTTEAVTRSAAQQLMGRISAEFTQEGGGLLAGEVTVVLELADGTRRAVALDLPPGAPGRPPDQDDVDAKERTCGNDVPGLLADADWSTAPALLRAELGVEKGQVWI